MGAPSRFGLRVSRAPGQGYLTTCIKRGELAGACSGSPLYSAITLCVPGASPVILKSAFLFVSEVSASIVLPSNSLTVPRGPLPVFVSIVTTKLTGLLGCNRVQLGRELDCTL